MLMTEKETSDDQKELGGPRSPWMTPVADASGTDASVMGAETWPALGGAPPRPKSTDTAMKPPALDPFDGVSAAHAQVQVCNTALL